MPCCGGGCGMWSKELRLASVAFTSTGSRIPYCDWRKSARPVDVSLPQPPASHANKHSCSRKDVASGRVSTHLGPHTPRRLGLGGTAQTSDSATMQSKHLYCLLFVVDNYPLFTTSKTT